MRLDIAIRAVTAYDYAQWRPLWDGYNAFYGRSGPTALAEGITEATWKRFLDPAEPMHAVVAADESGLVGIAHFLYHRSTTRLRDVCYLQDLFTAPASRGRGVARALIQHVYDAARAADSSRVYWTTQVTNQPARLLYDKVAKHLGFIVYTHEITAMRSKPKDVDAYIRLSQPAVRATLRRIRATIRAAAPRAEEVISYGIPAFRQDGVIVYFAAFKQHIGFFPPLRDDARLQAAAARYANEKGNLRFPLDEPIPYALIGKIVRRKVKQNLVRARDRRLAGSKSRARKRRPA
jgi:uncharacterized protein YdhG (YjbR/CyaY superfamily)/GNAT superfamily N-acetyltransferase